MTLTEDVAIAAAAMMGESSSPDGPDVRDSVEVTAEQVTSACWRRALETVRQHRHAVHASHGEAQLLGSR